MPWPEAAHTVGAAPRPEEGVLLKVESTTLVWSQRAADGAAEVVKMYFHRGAWTAMRGAFMRCRTEREHRALVHLLAHGVPGCEPRSWGRGFSRRFGFYEVLATTEIAGAVTLAEVLRRDGGGLLSLDLAPMFRVVRGMHDSGLFHGMLFPRNMLVAGPAGAEQFYVIDAPRSVLFPGSIVGTAMAREDLLALASRLLARPGGCEEVRAYGLSDGERHRLGERARRYSSSKVRRQARRGAFLARAMWAHARVALAASRKPAGSRRPVGLDPS
jgi:hypothetical protein